jgi:hypothetical protein
VSLKAKLNVWRLQSEWRLEDSPLGRVGYEVLVLRDERGAEIGVARSVFEKDQLKKRYQRYNKVTRTEDLPVSKKLRAQLAFVIGNLKRRGFIYREICFGNVKNRRTGKWEYKRAEIFKATPWTRLERFRIVELFRTHQLKHNLGIFVVRDRKLYVYPIKTKSKLIPLEESVK